MNITQIEWVRNPDGSQGYTLNSKTGCDNHTPEGLCLGGLFPCYAFKLAHGRLQQRYVGNRNIALEPNIDPNYISDNNVCWHDPFYPRWWPERLKDIKPIPSYAGRFNSEARNALIEGKRKGIFLDDMSDWMGDYWPREYTEAELQMMRDNPWHRIYTLTKQPQNLLQFSPFPENCWVGVTATNDHFFMLALDSLNRIEAKVKYISCEPLLHWNWDSRIERLPIAFKGINWLIIGACTGTPRDMVQLQEKYPDLQLLIHGRKCTAQPRIEWIREIVEAADKAGIKVFLKDNLRPLLIPEDCNKPNYLTDDIFWASEKAQLRQELPK